VNVSNTCSLMYRNSIEHSSSIKDADIYVASATQVLFDWNTLIEQSLRNKYPNRAVTLRRCINYLVSVLEGMYADVLLCGGNSNTFPMYSQFCFFKPIPCFSYVLHNWESFINKFHIIMFLEVYTHYINYWIIVITVYVVYTNSVVISSMTLAVLGCTLSPLKLMLTSEQPLQKTLHSHVRSNWFTS